MDKTQLNKVIDHYQKQIAVPLTPREVIARIEQVLAEHEGEELSVLYIFFQLSEHPEQYGIEETYQLPLLPEFTAICRGKFPAMAERSVDLGEQEYKEGEMEKEYPKMLYVDRENEGGSEEWLHAEEQPHDLADINEPRKLVGVYKLVGMGELVTEVTLRPESGDKT